MMVIATGVYPIGLTAPADWVRRTARRSVERHPSHRRHRNYEA